MKPIDRVEKLIKFKGISISAFEQETGMSNNSIQTAIKRQSNLKDSTINSILDTYKDISPIWLLRGEGEMLREPAEVNIERSVLQNIQHENDYTRSLIELLFNSILFKEKITELVKNEIPTGETDRDLNLIKDLEQLMNNKSVTD
ncbi:hypothetical protein [Flavobacterium caseinilyticum]|uniref:XRE family transcriptional regulator n=1 Tax=Flavobacterium caseinilyticum TaxID=2541732 RepID=A0A4R5AW89_9FLAO|nr:hypothetical protein [Flavobacterium caseinilyticum]TDD77083.1 hypothetical protein E0F89_05655 [Flavobacterium caseinilyticum]